jgi:hypothetical protein
MNDGRHLEALVAFVEERMLPKGFDVKCNRRVYNEEGAQIAEFDVEIRGRLGTTDIAWLIECRDRPSSGPAPGNWIEQLVGRKSRFGFNKVTAVSTTGFADGAIEFALQQGIELRVVDALTPNAFSWLQLQDMRLLERRAKLDNARILVNANVTGNLRSAVEEVVSMASESDKILRSIRNGEQYTVSAAFLGAVEQQSLFEGVDINGRAKKVALHVSYTNDHDHFVVDTKLGAVRAEVIVFHGELTAVESLVPVDARAKYISVGTGETISQVVAFEPRGICGQSMALELHRMGEDGETYVMLRGVGNDA